jgi:hypothetical protein
VELEDQVRLVGDESGALSAVWEAPDREKTIQAAAAIRKIERDAIIMVTNGSLPRKEASAGSMAVEGRWRHDPADL